MRMAHIVQVYLDIDSHICVNRAWRPTTEWVKNRLDLFKRLTLPSLLKQEFNGFRIWLLCGNEHKKITSKHRLMPKVEIFYDLGKTALASVDADYLAVTRLDSDDLLHRYAMREILRNVRPTDRRDCLIFRTYLVWDTNQRFIIRVRRNSPCFITHIFPREIYKDWPEFQAQHFLWHEKAGGRNSRTRELMRDMACAVKHTNNFGNLKKNEEAALVKDIKELRKKH